MDSQKYPPAPQFKSINSSMLRLLYGPTLTSIHDYRKNHSLSIRNFVGKVISLLLNMLSRFIIAFLPRWSDLLLSNINNLRYADETTLMAESEEELKSLLKKVKEESEKAGLKLIIQKQKIIASGPITSWQIDGENNGNSDRLYFPGLQNHCSQWLQPWNEKLLAPWK